MSEKTSDTKVGATAPTDLDNHAAKADGSPNDPMLDINAIQKAEAVQVQSTPGSATGVNLDPGNLATTMPEDSVDDHAADPADEKAGNTVEKGAESKSVAKK